MRFSIFARSLLLASATIIIPLTAVHAQNYPSGSMNSAPSVSVPQVNAAAEYRKGIEALKAQRFAEAKRAFARVLDVAPKDANANFLAGLAHGGLGDLKNARRHYERAVKSDSGMVAARQELGVTYAKLGEKEKAQAELASLNAMAAKCAEGCAKAADIKNAVEAVSTAMGQGPQARL
jgi:tetratricopeptide (TPR) repeat protein